MFSAFAVFLDVRFRFFDYNIGRESARAALIRFSAPNKERSNPNLVYWREPKNLLSDNDWKRPIKGDNGRPTNLTQDIDKAKFSDLAKGSSLSALLQVVDREKRKLIHDELIKRTGALIDFFNEKLDQKDENNTNKPFFNGFGRRYLLKPIILPLAKIFLWLQLEL